MRPEQPKIAPVRVQAPKVAPVSLDEMKRHLRDVCSDDDDVLLTSLIEGATNHLDGYAGILGRALVTQTWRQDFPAFGDILRLPLGPLAASPGVAVTYFDSDNTTQTLPDTIYAVHTDTLGPCIVLKAGQHWPATYQRADAVSATFTVGTAPGGVSSSIKVAIMLLVAHWYNNPEAVGDGTMGELPFAVSALIGAKSRIAL